MALWLGSFLFSIISLLSLGSEANPERRSAVKAVWEVQEALAGDEELGQGKEGSSKVKKPYRKGCWVFVHHVPSVLS